MKKKFSLVLGIAALFLGAVTLTGCTASFCSTKDTANILFAVDNGVTAYYDSKNTEIAIPEEALPLPGYTDVYYTTDFYNTSAVGGVSRENTTATLCSFIDQATEKNIISPDKEDKNGQLAFFAKVDEIVLTKSFEKLSAANTSGTPLEKNYTNLLKALHTYGYVKYYDDAVENSVIWDNFDKVWEEAAIYIVNTKGIDYVPSTDFKSFYRTTLSSSVTSFRSCLTTVEGDYGAYGPGKEGVTMEAKSYADSWSKGLFEGLLVWPLGGFIDVLTTGFGYNVQTNTPNNGVPQMLAILVVTVIIRLVMALATYKQTMGNAKMTELQPEIQKIQAKYPNSNTNKYEKQRMAEEMQKIYKKNKINPFTTIIVLIIQFPVFICVWGALSGSAVLTNGEFLGLKLGESISSVLFDGVRWTAAGGYGAVTALFLFILMGLAQTVAMLLPQWMQKAKAKKVAKLGKNPAQKSQDNKMKWVTYIMLIMIIVMGFSLVSAMGVYWLVGALFSIAQTLITTKITEMKTKKSKGAK